MELKGAVDMPTTKPGEQLPNDSRISRGDFDKMKEHLKMACSDFPKTTEYVEEVLEAFVESIRRKKENKHGTVIQSLTLEGDTEKKLENMGFKCKIYHKKQSIHSPMPYFVKEELVSEEGRGGIVTESASSSFIIVFYRIVNDTPEIFFLPTAENWHDVNEIACDSFPNQIASKMMKEFTYREVVDISKGPLKATEQHAKSDRVLPREKTNSNEIEGKLEGPVLERFRAKLNIIDLRFKKDKKAIIVKGNLSFSDILNVLVMFSQICSEGETSNECPPIGIDDILRKQLNKRLLDKLKATTDAGKHKTGDFLILPKKAKNVFVVLPDSEEKILLKRTRPCFVDVLDVLANNKKDESNWQDTQLKIGTTVYDLKNVVEDEVTLANESYFYQDGNWYRKKI